MKLFICQKGYLHAKSRPAQVIDFFGYVLRLPGNMLNNPYINSSFVVIAGVYKKLRCFLESIHKKPVKAKTACYWLHTSVGRYCAHVYSFQKYAFTLRHEFHYEA